MILLMEEFVQAMWIAHFGQIAWWDCHFNYL